MAQNINGYIAELTDTVKKYALFEVYVADIILRLKEAMSYVEIQKLLEEIILPHNQLCPRRMIRWSQALAKLEAKEIPIEVIIRGSLTRWHDVMYYITSENADAASYMLNEQNYKAHIMALSKKGGPHGG